MINGTKVAELKDLLAEIHLQDVRLVAETNDAMERMAEIGVDQQQVRDWLTATPIDADPGGKFHGFKNRKQAALAAFGAMSKKDRPGALGDVADRVNTLIKVQVPERATSTVGIAIVEIPAMNQLPPPEETVRRYRRMGDGKLKEIGPIADESFIDVPVDQFESTVTYKKQAKAK